jgi:hypothetical protein
VQVEEIGEEEIGSVLSIIEETNSGPVHVSTEQTEKPPEPHIPPAAAFPPIVKPAKLNLDQFRAHSILPGSNNPISALNQQSTVKKVCKHCRSMNIERRRRIGWEKIVLPLLKSYRYLCYSCGRDFYAKRAV